MSPIKHISFVLLLLLFPLSLFSNVSNFEGKIKLVREGVYDTATIVLYVKANLVRIDIQNLGLYDDRTFIIDLNREQVVVMSNIRKQFAEIPKQYAPPRPTRTEVVPRKNSMPIMGIRCSQIIVKNPDTQTVTSFWMAKRQFDFVPKLLRIMQKNPVLQSQLRLCPNASEQFPYMIVTRTKLRKFKERIMVEEINETPLSGRLFQIPENYQQLIIRD